MILERIKEAMPAFIRLNVLTAYYKMRAAYDRRNYINFTKSVIARTNHNRPAEVAIFIMVAENWNSFEALYRTIQQDARLNITVYVFPGRVFTDKPNELNLKLYGEVLEFFRARGIDVVRAYDTDTGKYIAPETVKADYVFYDEPYEIYPEGFKIRDMYKRSRICYSSYDCEIGENKKLLHILIPMRGFRFIYAYFAPGDIRANYAEKLYDWMGHEHHHVLRLGNPRFDLLKKLRESPNQGGGGIYNTLESPLHVQRLQHGRSVKRNNILHFSRQDKRQSLITRGRILDNQASS